MTTLLVCLLAIALSCVFCRTPREHTEYHYARRHWRQRSRVRTLIFLRGFFAVVALAIVITLYVTGGIPSAEARARRVQRDSVRTIQFHGEPADRLHYVILPARATREQVLQGDYSARRPRQSGGAR
jgi:hypothetical protein